VEFDGNLRNVVRRRKRRKQFQFGPFDIQLQKID
jgi:hypothetical protein